MKKVEDILTRNRRILRLRLNLYSRSSHTRSSLWLGMFSIALFSIDKALTRLSWIGIMTAKARVSVPGKCAVDTPLRILIRQSFL